MNKLTGEIYNIETIDDIALVDIKIGSDEFNSLIINSESTDQYIFVGNKVKLLFKETEISIKSYHNKVVKRQNKVIVDVVDITKGQILSELKLNYKENMLSALVLTRLLNELKLEIGNKAIMILRSQEVLLDKI